MSLRADPNAEARSLMNRQPCICSGAKTGTPCKNFWGITQKFDAANADVLRKGERKYACTLMSGWPLEWVHEEEPVHCVQYQPRPLEGLVALVARAVGLVLGLKPNAGSSLMASTPGYTRYDDAFHEFKPMSLEEIEALRLEFPDLPVQWSHGLDPSKMTIADILASEPVNMLKPGEQIPGTLSAETRAAVDGIFDDKSGGGAPAAVAGIFDGGFLAQGIQDVGLPVTPVVDPNELPELTDPDPKPAPPKKKKKPKNRR